MRLSRKPHAQERREAFSGKFVSTLNSTKMKNLGAVEAKRSVLVHLQQNIISCQQHPPLPTSTFCVAEAVF